MKSGPSSQTESAPAVGISRAATFPAQTPAPVGGVPRTSLDAKPFQLNTLSHPNLRQSYQELLSPADLSASGTPDSSSTGNSIHGSQYSMPQYSNNGVPDLSAMMFPSADPFAYPNQPLIELDNVKQENFSGLDDGSQGPSMYVPNNNNGLGMYDDLEGQLFGPIPPYLMQGQQQYDMPGQMDGANNLMSGQNPQGMQFHTGLTPGAEINFDGIFSGDGEEWSNMGEQSFR
jgi:hypothetical protein